jgi:deoxycytidine triphosphate deaminase
MLIKSQIEVLIRKKQLIEGAIDVTVQITPNGFDLTCGTISRYCGSGAVDFSNKERQLPAAEEVPLQKKNPHDQYGWWELAKGIYKVKTNEIVNLPNDLTALAFSRTTLLRMGAFTQHGVWDAGFRGKGEFVLVVENPHGISVQQNARIAQLIFLPIKKTSFIYRGIFRDLT